MKAFIFISFIIVMLIACRSVRYDVLGRHRLDYVNTNSSRGYIYRGKYCIDTIKDTAFAHGEGIIDITVFDGIKGDTISNGVAWFISKDTTRVIFKQSRFSIKLPEGLYFISIDALRLPVAIRNLRLTERKKVILSAYMGGSRQY